MKNVMKYVLLFLCLHFSVATAFAQTETESGLTPMTSESGVVYVNGGIGKDQQEELKTMRKDFNLQLTFAEKGTGEYLSNVHLSIENSSGTQLVKSGGIGPIFLVKLAPGTYQIKAKTRDKMQTKAVSVNKSGIRDLYFYW